MAQMTRPVWTLTEMRPGEWWATDTAAGTAFLLDPSVAERLWRASDAQTKPLASAIRMSDLLEQDRFVDLEYLGVRMRYRCAEPRIADEIARLYESIHLPLRRSPDIIIKLHSDVDFDRIHRSIDGDRKGVCIQLTGSGVWLPGSPNLPVLPALQYPGFTGRFCALHAALLATSRGGVLVCGEQKMGKTTAVLLASRLGLASLLADETVLINRCGKAFALPLPVRERSGDGRFARALPKVEDSIHAAARTTIAIILLDRCENSPSWTHVDSPVDRIRLLVPHMRVLDGPLGQATDCILKLLQGAQVWSWRLRRWPALVEDLEQGLRRVLE